LRATGLLAEALTRLTSRDGRSVLLCPQKKILTSSLLPTSSPAAKSARFSHQKSTDGEADEERVGRVEQQRNEVVEHLRFNRTRISLIHDELLKDQDGTT
jgi:hypothetical protein